MRSFASIFAVLAAAAAAALLSAPANAQATRTWVSGVGDDANPCSRTAPCKTLAGAISKTAAGGEINCLDPAGLGGLTITKSINIVCDYTEGGVLAGSNGILVNALATDKVYLSGLDFHGVTGAADGIRILNAANVTIKNVSIRNFIDGIEVANAANTIEVSVIDSIFANNTGTGILVRPTGSGSVRMNVIGSKMLNNTNDGLMANATAPTTGTIHVTVRDSESAHNGLAGLVAFSAGAVAQMMIDGSTAFNNNRGIVGSGTNALVRFGRSSVTRNDTGVQQVGAGVVQSYTPASNMVDGNTTDGTFGTTPFK